MTDVWILIHLAFIQILLNRKRSSMSLWCFLLPFLVPTLAAPNRTAVINVYKAEKPSSRPQLTSTVKNGHAVAENVRGKYSELGNVKETNGRLHMVTRINILFVAMPPTNAQHHSHMYVIIIMRPRWLDLRKAKTGFNLFMVNKSINRLE